METAFHEAIHALQDEARYPNEVVEAEAVAYVGEFAYALSRARMDRFSVRARGDIEESALRVARHLRIHARSHTYIRREDLAAVEQAIHNSPAYPSRGVPTRFDGWN